MNLSGKNILLSIVSVIALSSPALSWAQAPAAPDPKVAPKQDTAETIPAEKIVPAKKVTPTPEAPKKTEAKIYGWKEWVWVIKPELILRAKLDTGARTCSVHATNIEKVEIDGKQWMKFTISDPQNKKSARVRYKAPLLRISKIKNDTGGIDERYVVPLTFQIGDRKLVGEFNLNDRSDMVCAMLIGRNILQKIGYVDSARTYLLEKPKAPKTKKPARSEK